MFQKRVVLNRFSPGIGRLRWQYEILPATRKCWRGLRKAIFALFKPHAKNPCSKAEHWLVGMLIKRALLHGDTRHACCTMLCLVSLLQNTAMSLNRIGAADGRKQLTWWIPPSLHGCPVYEQKNTQPPPFILWITACQLCSIHLPLTLFPCFLTNKSQTLAYAQSFL